MMINTLHIMIINIILIVIVIGIFFMVTIGLLTTELQKKPKSNKFRQWWNKYIVDMDGNYNN